MVEMVRMVVDGGWFGVKPSAESNYAERTTTSGALGQSVLKRRAAFCLAACFIFI